MSESMFAFPGIDEFTYVVMKRGTWRIVRALVSGRR